MSKYLFFTDPHIDRKGEFSETTEDGLTTYLHRVRDSLLWVSTQIANTSPDYVVCGGDVFDSTGYVDSSSNKVAAECLWDISKTCSLGNIPFYILAGNHDFESIKNNIHNLHFLERFSVVVVDRPCEIRSGVFLLPWAEKLDLDLLKNKRLTFSHVDVIGSPLIKGKPSDVGLSESDFSGLVINGHYHNPSKVGKVINVGSLVSRNFRDVDSARKRIALIDDETLNVEFMENPHDVQFVDISLNDKKVVDKISKELRTGDLDKYCNVYMRVKFDEDSKELADSISAVAKNAKLELLPRKIDQVVDAYVDETFSPDENLKGYVNTVISDKEKAGKVISKGSEYIRRVLDCDDRVSNLPIIFSDVTIKNYQSVTFLYLNLKDIGMLYVQGANGSGKSTIPEAIYWCITGVSLRGYTGDDVIQYGKDNVSVSLNFSVGSKKYSIIRTRGSTGNKVQLNIIGESDTDISLRKKRDTDKEIQRLIGRSRTVLQHSVFLTSDLNTKFTSLSYPDRVKLLEQVTDSDIYSDVYVLVDKDYKDLLSRVDAFSIKLKYINENISSLQTKRDRLSEEFSTAKSDRESSLLKYKSALSDLYNKRDIVQNELSKYSSLSKSTSEEIAFHNNTRDEVNAKYLDISKQLVSIQRDIRNSEETSKNYSSLIAAGKCPTCHSEISKDHELLHELSSIDSCIGDFKKTEYELSIDTRELKRCLDEISSLIGSKTTENNKVNKAILESSSFLRDIEEDINKVKISLDKIRNSLDLYTAKFEELNLLLDDYTKDSLSVETDIKFLNQELDILSEVKDAFSTKGIRSRVLSTVTLPFINKRLDMYSDILGMQCYISCKREKKSSDIVDELDVIIPGNKTYKGCSRGEKRKIDIAIQCAINDLAIATGGSYINLLVCDEIIDPMDDEGVFNFISILKKKSADTSIVLISHRPFVSTYFSNKLLLVNKNGETEVTTSI